MFDFELIKTDGGFAFYRMVLEPWLAFLKLRHNSAAFHNLTVADLTSTVCSSYLKRDIRQHITGVDTELTYACQYNESDFNFLHRHWEARGSSSRCGTARPGRQAGQNPASVTP